MRLKDLFTVPAGQKITEKHLWRVLGSSICSILLCMTCLVSATWAWYNVSVENDGNVIWIGQPGIHMTVDGASCESGTELSGSEIELTMAHANHTDDFDKKSTLYVTLNLQKEGATAFHYVTLNESNDYSSMVRIQNDMGDTYTVSWIVSWFPPDNAAALIGDTIVLGAEGSSADATTEATTDTTEATTKTTEATTETTESVQESSDTEANGQ